MNTSVNTKTALPGASFEISETLRQLLAAMPVVIFFNAVVGALKASRGRPTGSLQASRH